MAFVKVPGNPIELDGKTFIMPPLSIGVLEQMDDTAMDMLASPDITAAKMRLVCDIVTASLTRNYPDIERSFVADNLYFGDIETVVPKLMKTSGLTKESGASPGE